MRRSASEVIRTLEMRVARLERQAGFGHRSSSHNKRAFMSDLVSKVSDIYAKLKSDLPGEKEKKKILAKVASDLEKELLSSINGFKRHWFKSTLKGKVNCSIKSNKLVISISFADGSGSGSSSINLQISEMSDLKDLRDLVSSFESKFRKHNRNIKYAVPFELWTEALSIITKTLEKPLFLPMLQGDLATLSDRVSAPLKKEYEKKFWNKLNKFSPVTSKVLKALAKVGVGALVIGLCISVFMITPWGLVAGGIAGLFKLIMNGLVLIGMFFASAFVGKVFTDISSLQNEMKKWSSERDLPSDPEETLEMFLELLEREGVA